MTTDLRVLGINGSLRKGSFNALALRAAQKLMPAGARLDLFDGLEEIPPFNQEFAGQPPHAVARLKAEVRASDAILICTPEYNHSLPGVLKNAIDWASFPPPDNAWAGKPAAVMGASLGLLGTARAQYHLRQVLVFLDVHAVNKPEVLIGQAPTKFSDSGDLVDENARALLSQLLGNLCKLAVRLRD